MKRTSLCSHCSIVHFITVMSLRFNAAVVVFSWNSFQSSLFQEPWVMAERVDSSQFRSTSFDWTGRDSNFVLSCAISESRKNWQISKYNFRAVPRSNMSSPQLCRVRAGRTAGKTQEPVKHPSQSDCDPAWTRAGRPLTWILSLIHLWVSSNYPL